MQRGKNDGRADEQHRLVLQGRHDDLVRRAHAVNVRWAIGDGEIARIHHAQINVQRLPELFGAPGAGLGAALAAGVGPALADALAAFGVLAAIFVQTAYVGLEPRIEHGGAHRLQELADAIAPAEPLLCGAGSHKIHRPG